MAFPWVLLSWKVLDQQLLLLLEPVSRMIFGESFENLTRDKILNYKARYLYHCAAAGIQLARTLPCDPLGIRLASTLPIGGIKAVLHVA